MTEIPIKIKRSGAAHRRIAHDLRIDLRKTSKHKKTSRRWWGVLIVLLLIILALLVYVFLLKPKQKEVPFAELMPPEPIVFSIIEKDKIYNKIIPFDGPIGQQCSFYQWFLGKADNYFDQAGLDFEQDILPLFKEQMGLGMFEANEQASFPFIVFLQKKAASAQINRILNLIEQQLKKDFYSSDELYRQNNIISLKSIYSPSLIYYYTQVKDYLLISNSQEYLEKTIDLIIGNNY